MHLRSRHVLAVKITNRRSGREGFFCWWRLCGWRKVCADLIKCSSTTDGNGRAHMEKHNIFLSFKKKKACTFQTRLSSHFNSSFEAVYFNDKCPERIIVMRERNKCLRSQDSLHSHTKQMRSLSRSDIRPTCVCSNLILSPGLNAARSATSSVGNGHPPAET